MRTGARTRRTGVSRGGRDRFEKAVEAVESRGWIGRGYSHGAQEFRCVLLRMLCIVSPFAWSLSQPVSACYAKSGICRNRIVSSACRVGPNANSMIIELCNACM